MEFTKALRKIYEDNALSERIYNPFYVYCVLSDLCHGSFEEMRMVKVYYAVNTQVNLFGELICCGATKGLERLKNRYKELSGVEYNDYKRCVIATVLAVQPDYEFSKKSNKEPARQLAYDVAKQAADVHNAQAAKKSKKKSKQNITPQEKFVKTRDKLAQSFFDYFQQRFCDTKAIHFLRRRRIMDRGYDWYFKILSATDISSLNSLYQRGKNAIDAI